MTTHDRDLFLRDGDMRLQGALMHAEAHQHVVTEAMRRMVEARFLLRDCDIVNAVLVLEAGIRETRHALNLDQEPPA